MAGCGQPPEKEMQDAQAAITSARAAGADRYAVEEFRAAEDALKRAHDASAQRDFRLALNNALDSRERARNAAAQATTRKAEARDAADRALTELTTVLLAARDQVQAAERGKLPARVLGPLKEAVATADARVQEAREAAGRENYAAASALAADATAALTEASAEFKTAAATPVRRRR
jgi:hypothetical protein